MVARTIRDRDRGIVYDVGEAGRVTFGRDVTGAVRGRGGDHAERGSGQPLPVHWLQHGPVFGGSAPTWRPQQLAQFGLGRDLGHACYLRHHASCSGSSSGGVGVLRMRSKCGEGAGTGAGSGCWGTSTGPCWPDSSSAGTSLPGSPAASAGSPLAGTLLAGTLSAGTSSAGTSSAGTSSARAQPAAPGWASSLVGSSKSGSASRASSASPASSACPDSWASPVLTESAVFPAAAASRDLRASPAARESPASLVRAAAPGSAVSAPAALLGCSASPGSVVSLRSVTWAVNVARPLTVALGAPVADSLACRAAVFSPASAAGAGAAGRAPTAGGAAA